MSASELFEILLMSAVICKQRFLHENEIVQYLQNYKYQDVNRGYFRKPVQAATNLMKNDYPKPAYTFLRAIQYLTTFYV